MPYEPLGREAAFGILPREWQVYLGPGDLYYSDGHARWCDIPPKWYGRATAEFRDTAFRRPGAAFTYRHDPREWADEPASEPTNDASRA